MRTVVLVFASLGFISGCGASTSSRKVELDASPDAHGSGSGGASNGDAASGDSSSAGGASSSGGSSSGGSSGGGSLDASLGDLDGSVLDAGASCSFGSAGGYATQHQVDLYGTTIDYFNGGQPLPPGRYRLNYDSGCMKYSGDQGWTIHAYANGQTAAWWAVGDTTDDRIVVPPGTVGVFPGDAGAVYLGGAYDTFDECVEANRQDPPVEFQFQGGKLGVWVLDNNYGDNLAGPDGGLGGGGSPKWTLTLLGACVNGDR